MTPEGREIDLSQDRIEALRTRLRGPLLMSGAPGYEDSRTVWNAMIDARPAMVARCIGTADVIACVQFARENDLLVCIKGGGHNIAGLATADGALMLDLSMMRGAWVDARGGIVHAHAGCLLGDVDRETQLHGRAAVLGFVSATGIAGLTLGGGFGYLTRRWGWTADTVVGMDVVTAEGPEVLGGLVAWPASEAPKVLELYRGLSEQAPPEMTLVALVRPAPPAPWLPKEWHGKPIIALLACHTGAREDAERAVAPIKSFGQPIGDALVRRPYAQLQTLLDAAQPKGRRYYWKSEYLPRIEPALCAKVVEHAARIQSPHAAIILFQIGGALNDLDEEHSAVGNRQARYVLNIAGAWEHAQDDVTNVEWARTAWNDMKSFSTGGTYLNFLTQDDGIERTTAALGAALPRLAHVKTNWDPTNFFRTNRNIRPA
jgi:hypothetical protein